MARGELEKALLAFYTNLAYGTSPDLYQTVERVNVLDSNYSPFQPNSSANGRILSAMRRMVIDEQDEAQGVLWLLRACPRRWFAAGKSVSATDAPTLFGKMAVKTHGDRRCHHDRSRFADGAAGQGTARRVAPSEPPEARAK